MSHKQHQLGKITFGNILLVILVLGTLVVGGLMYKLYQALTETPERTANWQQQQQQQPIEVMSPDGKPGERVYRKPGEASAPPAATPQTPAAASTPPSAQNVPPGALEDENALKAPAPAKRNTAKKPAAATDIPAEQPLKPEPANNRPLPGETPLRPTNNPPANNPEPRERPLKPQPSGGGQKSGGGDAIEELF